MHDFLDVGVGVLSCWASGRPEFRSPSVVGNELADKVHAALVGASLRARGKVVSLRPPITQQSIAFIRSYFCRFSLSATTADRACEAPSASANASSAAALSLDEDTLRRFAPDGCANAPPLDGAPGVS